MLNNMLLFSYDFYQLSMLEGIQLIRVWGSLVNKKLWRYEWNIFQIF